MMMMRLQGGERRRQRRRRLRRRMRRLRRRMRRLRRLIWIKGRKRSPPRSEVQHEEGSGTARGCDQR